MKTKIALLVCVCTVALALPGCSAKSRHGAVRGAPTDQGPGSVEYVRRQFQGSWTLQRFEVADAAGALKPVRADATLNYDEFGNIKVHGIVHEPLPGNAPADAKALLDYEGRITIDPVKHEFRLMDPESAAPVDPSLQKTIGTGVVRHYVFDADRVTVEFVTAAGVTTARTVFVRQK